MRKGNAIKEIITGRWEGGWKPGRVIMHGLNRLFAGRANVGRWNLFILVPLLCIEALAAALIVRVDQFLHLDTIQSVKPPIERDTIQE